MCWYFMLGQWRTFHECSLMMPYNYFIRNAKAKFYKTLTQTKSTAWQLYPLPVLWNGNDLEQSFLGHISCLIASFVFLSARLFAMFLLISESSRTLGTKSRIPGSSLPSTAIGVYLQIGMLWLIFIMQFCNCVCLVRILGRHGGVID